MLPRRISNPQPAEDLCQSAELQHGLACVAAGYLMTMQQTPALSFPMGVFDILALLHYQKRPPTQLFHPLPHDDFCPCAQQHSQACLAEMTLGRLAKCCERSF